MGFPYRLFFLLITYIVAYPSIILKFDMGFTIRKLQDIGFTVSKVIEKPRNPDLEDINMDDYISYLNQSVNTSDVLDPIDSAFHF